MSRVAVVGRGLTAAALAVLLSASPSPAVLPPRHLAFEPETDLNQLLDDCGRRGERNARKAAKAQRLRDLQRRAFTGESA